MSEKTKSKSVWGIVLKVIITVAIHWPECLV